MPRALAQTQTVYLCDAQSLIFWEILAPSTIQVGRYVMGEPWIAIPSGQTVTVTRVGRFLVDPGSAGGSPSTPVDNTYPGPVIPAGPNPQWRHGTMKNPLGGGILRTVWNGQTNSHELRPQEIGYDDRVGTWYDPNPWPSSLWNYPGFDANLFLAINTTSSTATTPYGPVSLAPGDVLVSTESNPNTATGPCTGNFLWQTIYETCGGTCSHGNRCGNSPTKRAAVLSVIVNDANTPTNGQAFRKPYSLPNAPATSAANRLGLSHLTLAHIDWSVLPRAAWPANNTLYPTAAHGAAFVSRVWLDHHDGQWAEDRINPTDHMAGYGQYQREMLCTVAAMACLNPDAFTPGTPSGSPPNSADFRRMIYGLLQAGIDTWGLTQDPTHAFAGGGGKGGGRKFPVVFAGKMFGSSAYVGLSPTLPSMATGPWTVSRLVQGVVVDVPRFAEDQQMFEAPSGALDLTRPDWDWQGSPWLWGSTLTDRVRQHSPPNPSTNWTCGQQDGESKRFLSSSAYVGIAIALRMLGLEQAWNNRAFLGYMDRWMIPGHAAAVGGITGYLSTSPGCSINYFQGIQSWTDITRIVHDLNPQSSSGTFTLDVWDKYRWCPTQSGQGPTGCGPVAYRPNDFVFTAIVPQGSGNNCVGIRRPTLLTQFVPLGGTDILVELYASETFTVQAPTSWATFLIGGYYNASGVPLTYPGALNADTVFVDPNGAWSLWLVPGTYGYVGYRMNIPSLLFGYDVAVQGAFIELDCPSPGSCVAACVAASNALVMEVQ